MQLNKSENENKKIETWNILKKAMEDLNNVNITTENVEKNNNLKNFNKKNLWKIPRLFIVSLSEANKVAPSIFDKVDDKSTSVFYVDSPSTSSEVAHDLPRPPKKLRIQASSNTQTGEYGLL